MCHEFEDPFSNSTNTSSSSSFGLTQPFGCLKQVPVIRGEKIGTQKVTMTSLNKSRERHAKYLAPSSRRSCVARTAIQSVFIGAIVLASAATIVSGFLFRDSLVLPVHNHSEDLGREINEFWRLQAVNCKHGNSIDYRKPEFNERMSRRQTLATLAATTLGLCSSPTKSAAESIETSEKSRPNQNTHTIATKFSTSEPSALQESLSGFVAGASLAGTKTLIKFPLDTATVRVQMPNSEYSIRDPIRLFDGCFNGISLTLLSNIPAGAVFFGVKDAVKSAIRNSEDSGISSMPRWLSTSLAVGVAMIPYWLIRNPSEVVKVRKQANIDGYERISAIDAIKQTVKSDESDNGKRGNISELYTGYWENVLYGLPADIVKFVAYESITKGRKDLSPLEGAGAGALATSLSQFVTTPLDVVRNRLMTGKNTDGSYLSAEEKKKGYIGNLITLGKEEGLSGLFAGSAPRASKAILSGAIQFATYEETKQSMSKKLLRQ